MAKKRYEKKPYTRVRPGRWQRGEPDVFNDEPKDEVGRVRIYVRAIDPENNSVQKGAISKSFTIQSGRVSEIAAVIERALFG